MGKKVIAILLIAAMVSGINIPAEAEESDVPGAEEVVGQTGTDLYTCGDYEYSLSGEDAVIESYTGAASDVSIPSELDGHTVTELSGFSFDQNTTIETVTIPATVTVISIAAFSENNTNLKHISVDSRNTVYKDEDGVLMYNYENKWILYVYPPAREGISYTVPQDVTIIGLGAFTSMENLETIVLPSTVSELSWNSFIKCKTWEKPWTIIINRVSDITFPSQCFKNLPYGSKIIVKTDAIKAELEEEKAEGSKIYPVGQGNVTVVSLESDSSYKVAETSLLLSDDLTDATVSADRMSMELTLPVGGTYSMANQYIQQPYNTTENVTWVSDDTDCATVDSITGRISGKTTGTCSITGTDETGNQITVNVTVYQKITEIGTSLIQVADQKNLYENVVYENTDNGCIQYLPSCNVFYEIVVKPYNANNRANITWYSSDESVATIKSYFSDWSIDSTNESYYYNDALLTIKNIGTTTITATLNDNGTVYEKSFTLTVTKRIADCTISSIPDQIYTGSAICPEITVWDGMTELKENTDYTVSYSHNIEAGTATATIMGVNGTYTDSKDITFGIHKINLNTAAVKINGSYVYNGKAQIPDISVVCNGNELTQGTDYTLSCNQNINAGAAVVTVSAVGNSIYTGNQSAKFQIQKANLNTGGLAWTVTDLSYNKKNQSVRLTGIPAGITVTYTGNKMKAAGKYLATARLTYDTTNYNTVSKTELSTVWHIRNSQSVSFYNQNIKGSTLTVPYGTAVFSLGAKAKTGMTYQSSNSKVAAVDKKGKVTIYGTGYTTLTVTAKQTNTYKKAVAEITVYVTPKQETITDIKSAKKSEMTVTWKKDSKASGYQVRYSVRSQSSKKVTVSIGKNSICKQTIGKLKRGKTYQVRVRAYKTIKIDGKSVKKYGKWSNVKNIKVK